LGAEQVILRHDGSKCAHPVGAIRFTEDGKHWQYAQMANFELRKDDPLTGDVLALRTKTYYCLLDTDAIRAADNLPHQYQAHCKDDVGRMGISAGWKDTYHRVFPGQWIDLDADPETPVAAGTYYLVNLANPTGELWEIDDSRQSNMSYARVRVNAGEPDAPAERPAAHRQAHQHPPKPPRTVRASQQPHTPRSPQPTRSPYPMHTTRPAQPVRPSRVPRLVPHAVPHHEPDQSSASAISP
jgi:hypothetical protein